MKLQQPTYCQVLNPEDRCVEDEKENNYETLKPSFFVKEGFFILTSFS
jgi:hypothetical protein